MCVRTCCRQAEGKFADASLQAAALKAQQGHFKSSSCNRKVLKQAVKDAPVDIVRHPFRGLEGRGAGC